MKNKILAIVLIIVVCFSIFTPMTVYAATTTTSASQINWTKKTINGEKHKITYFHPVGLDKYYILQNNNSTKVIFYNDEVSTVNDDYRYGVGEFVIFCIGKGVGWPGRGFDAQLAICRDLLYNDESTWRASTSSSTASNIANSVVWHMTSEEEETLSLTQGAYEAQAYGEQHKDVNVNSSFLSMEDSYTEWYFNKHGIFPPLVSNGDDEIEFMKGKYYAILYQESIIDISGTNMGFVDTVEKTYLESKHTTIHDDKEERGLVYVVISSDNTEGDILANNLVDGPMDYFIRSIGTIKAWIDGQLNTNFFDRNGYNLVDTYWFYTNKENDNLNRYYFNSLQDACKFVLYGTAGAEYLYKEIGKTHFGYGYLNCEFNNYDLKYFPKKEIPAEQYPLGRQEFILMQHDVVGEGRKFVYIESNYYSGVSMIDPNGDLIFNNDYTNAIYKEYIQGKEEFDPLDRTIYKINNTYEQGKTTTFKIYKEGMEDDTGTWAILHSTYNLYQIKQGQIIDFEEYTPTLQVWKDKDGNIATENTIANEVYVKGELDPYVKNEDGEYYNSKGERWDKENYTNELLNWQQSLKDYQDNLELMAKLIEHFTIFINNSSEQVEELTDLLKAVMLSIPRVFKDIILISVIALVFTRAIKRKGD